MVDPSFVAPRAQQPRGDRPPTAREGRSVLSHDAAAAARPERRGAPDHLRQPDGVDMNTSAPGSGDCTHDASDNTAAPDTGTDEVRIELRPVIKLANWVYDHHKPIPRKRTCPACGTQGCDPYRWAHEILKAAATFPIYTIKRTDA